MSVNSYLVNRASSAVLSGAEKASISVSLTTLQNRLASYFVLDGDGLTSHFPFGSFTRGTILPRRDDSSSDVDYMIVFEKGGLAPQSYLDRLKRFVEKRYSTSEIYQSSPTIVLELNHIKFDLVPALSGYWGAEYRIPKGSKEWRDTTPNDFNRSLETVNKANNYLVKPAIRLAKIWNSSNGDVFDSYSFEKWIAERSFWFCHNLRDYLFKIFDGLNESYNYAAWRNERIRRAKGIVAKVRELETLYGFLAEAEVKKLIPE